jgi:hypothetical protein
MEDCDMTRRSRSFQEALLDITLAACLSICLCGAASADGGGDANRAGPSLSQVYLIQNSGWMEPFYADQGSQFRTIVTSLIDSTQLVGVGTIVATFNQGGQISGHPSPEMIFSGPYDQSKVATIVGNIQPPRRSDGKYADSDFFGALTGTITSALSGHQGIIWMITNNKDSPNNSQEVVANTQKFYDDLRGSEFIRRIVAFPIRMRVHGPHYDEHGFIIYGIAYGDQAARALNFLIADGQPIRKIFTAPPVRLKPLDQDPLKLQLTAQASGQTVAALENGILTIRHIPSSSDTHIVLTGDLVNSYYPQQVEQAQLSATGAPINGVIPFEAHLSPEAIQNLPPGGALKGVSIDLHFAPVRRSSIFQDHVEADGYLVIKLSNATLTLGSDFVERMKDVFGIDLLVRDQRSMKANGLPAVFFDYQRVNAASTVIPVRLVYDFSTWPLILAVCAGLALLALLGGAAFLLVMPRKYSVRIGGSNVQVRLRPFETRVVQGGNGVRANVRGSLFGPPSVQPITSDHSSKA